MKVFEKLQRCEVALKNMTDAEIVEARGNEAADLLAFLLLYARHNCIDLDAALERKWFSYLRPAPENG